MSVYLHDIPLSEAIKRFGQALEEGGIAGILGSETIPVDEHAVGRVLSQPAWASLSSPHYHASAMDGFALRAEQIAGAMPTAPGDPGSGRTGSIRGYRRPPARLG